MQSNYTHTSKLLLFVLLLTISSIASAQVFNAIANGSCNSSNVTFTILNPSVEPIQWDFGDGSTLQDTSSVVQHVYSAGGSYVVDLSYRLSGDTTVLSAKDTLLIVFSSLSISISSSGILPTVALTANVTGGTPPYSYSWSNGATTQIITVQQAGTYSVTVTDANGCSGVNVFVVQGCTNNIALQGVPTSPCDTVCTGSVDITVTGNAPPFTYLWSNGDTTEDISGLCPGAYTLTVTDSTGCTSTYSAIISNGNIISTNFNAVPEDCGQSNGIANVQAFSNFGATGILWDANAGNSTDSIVFGLASGYYHYTITDPGLCTYTDSIFVPQGPLPAAGGSTSATCGQADGSAFVTYQTNSFPVTVDWDNGGSGNTITGLLAGLYVASIEDAAGCQAIVTVEVLDSCGAIQGTIFDDTNGNGVQDVGEPGYAGLTVTAMPGNITATSDQNGNYSIPIATFGTYTVSVSLPSSQFACSGLVTLQPTVTFPSSPGTHSAVVSIGTPIVSGNDFGISIPSPPCGIISGTVFDDTNGNGVQDVGEGGVLAQLINLSNGQFVYTDATGYYEVEVPFDTTVEISLLLNNGSVWCYGNTLVPVQTSPTNPDTYTVTLTSQSPNSTDNDFGVNKTTSDYDVGVYSIAAHTGTEAGQCFTAWMDFKVRGTLPTPCTLRVEFDTLVSFNNATIPPDNSGIGFIEWIFPAASGDFFICMQMNFCLSETADVGTVLEWSAEWTCGNADACAYNDLVERIFTVTSGSPKAEGIGGFNSKHVYHSGDRVNNVIQEKDSVLSYVIYFQNTGDDTAYHLTIMDTLSSILDKGTLTKAFSSHPHRYFVTSDNIVVWEFDDLMLPDSTTDYLNSYGFVQYNILVDKSKIQEGLTFGNGACMYWNYNESNCSNKALLTFDSDVSIAEEMLDDQLRIYPNPTKGEIVVNTNHALIESIEVLDMLGKSVYSRPSTLPSSTKQVINLDGQHAGIYMVRVHTGEGVVTKKIVLMD